jgi:hypothetical protein
VDSSLPWVLVGARRFVADEHRDGVLARGGDAGAELVGFVRGTEVTGDTSVRVGRFPGLGGERFSAVISETIAPSPTLSDRRPSSYMLAWQGHARASGAIHEQFEKCLPDILDAIERDAPGDVEWAISRVLFLVRQHEVRSARNRTVRWLLVVLYAVLAALLVLFFLL